MAKIIGYNKVYVTKYKATCDKCGAIIMFDENEVQHEHQYNEYCFTSATCPACGNKLGFDRKKAKVKEEVITHPIQLGGTLLDEHLIKMNRPSNCSGVCRQCQAKCLARTEPYDPKSF